MFRQATLAVSDDQALIDELVPPAGSRLRRWLIWLLVLALVGAATWLFTSGTATPRLSQAEISSYGGSGPIQLGVRAINASRVPIEVTSGPRSRPGLRLLGYGPDPALSALVVDPFPIRVQPGDTLDLTAWFDVEDCAAIARADAYDTGVDLQVRIADGPFSVLTRTRTVRANGGLSGDLGTWAAGQHQAPWPLIAAQYACPAP